MSISRVHSRASSRATTSRSVACDSSDDDWAKDAWDDARRYIQLKTASKTRTRIARMSESEREEAMSALVKLLDPTGKELSYTTSLRVVARSANRRSMTRPHKGKHKEKSSEDGGSGIDNDEDLSDVHRVRAREEVPTRPVDLPVALISSSEEHSEEDLLAPRKSEIFPKINAQVFPEEEEEKELSLRSTLQRSLKRNHDASLAAPMFDIEKDKEESKSDSEYEEELTLSSRHMIKGEEVKIETGSVARPRKNVLLSQEVGARPSFAIAAEQAAIGPYILDKVGKIEIPAPINRFLRPYQRDGIDFLYKAWKEGRGAILGDDMGLGKTVQVIGFLSAIMGKTGAMQDQDRRIHASRARRIPKGARANVLWPTCLVLCPQTVTGNWMKELETWGYFEVAQFGSGLFNPLQNFGRGRLDILVASHEYAVTRIEELKDMDFSCIFVDEAHKFKSSKTKGTQAVNMFKCPIRFAMTGTLMQNRYEEMWPILNWTNPGKFGRENTWANLIAVPLRISQRKGADADEIADGQLLSQLFTRNLLPPFFLRRTKALIADQMPKKFDKIVFCPLAAEQLHAYRKLCDLPLARQIALMNDPCPCEAVDEDGRRFRRKNCCEPAVVGSAFKMMYLMSCLANHAALFFPNPDDLRSPKGETRERYHMQSDCVKMLWPDSWQNKRCDESNGLRPDFCGKWLVLQGLLTTWHKQKDKVLLFSRSLRLLNWLQWFVEHSAWSFLRLDGSTPQGQRQQKVDEFNRDDSIFLFLISTRAGGTGLNLTGAQKVVVFDPSWNPADDLQAMDRAYRFGQQRDVHVYRLIGAGTLEEIIYGRQIYKAQAANIAYTASTERRFFSGVEGDQAHRGELFGLANMFTLRDDLPTKAIIEDCEVQETAEELQQFLTCIDPSVATATDHGTSSADAIAEHVLRTFVEPDDLTKGLGGGEGLEEEAAVECSTSVGSKRKQGLTSVSSESQGERRATEEEILASHGIPYVHEHQEVMSGSGPASRRRKVVSKLLDEVGGTGLASDVLQRQKKKSSTSTSTKSNVGSSGNRNGSALWPPTRRRGTTEAK